MSVEVLMVADNPGEVRLMREALRGSKRAINLHVALDGAEALDFLRQQKKHVRAPRPAPQDDTDLRPDQLHGPVGYRFGLRTQGQLLYQQAIAPGRTGPYRRHHQ
jgi:CheY-like chemotaxis protein